MASSVYAVDCGIFHFPCPSPLLILPRSYGALHTQNLDTFSTFFLSSFFPLLLPGISFIPHEVGEHRVSILKNGAHIPSSPISIMVLQSEIGDASLVKVYGDGLSQGTTSSDASFIVDTREAGQCQR